METASESNREKCWNTLRAQDATTQTGRPNVNAKKNLGLGNQQPSRENRGRFNDYPFGE